MDIVEEVRKHVYEKYHEDERDDGMNLYDIHVKYVVEYAKQLAKKLYADIEIVEISALLHDIGRLNSTKENHHIIGAQYAEEYLQTLGYPIEKIKRVKHCIFAHRGSLSIPRETIEAECVASADAMAHFRNISDMFYFVYHDLKESSEKGKQMVKDKFERSFNKMIPEGKEIVRDKYEAIMKILE